MLQWGEILKGHKMLREEEKGEEISPAEDIIWYSCYNNNEK